MLARKILVPTDFSPSSDAVLPQVTALARGSGATVILLHVEEPPLPYGGGEAVYGVPELNVEPVERMLERVVLPDPSIPVVRRLAIGDAATEIVRVAKEEQVDLIVMSTHGRTFLSRLLMGSVAEVVVRRAHCPVLTVRQPQSDPVEL